jgi:hypothetical protein
MVKKGDALSPQGYLERVYYIATAVYSVIHVFWKQIKDVGLKIPHRGYPFVTPFQRLSFPLKL